MTEIFFLFLTAMQRTLLIFVTTGEVRCSL